MSNEAMTKKISDVAIGTLVRTARYKDTFIEGIVHCVDTKTGNILIVSEKKNAAGFSAGFPVALYSAYSIPDKYLSCDWITPDTLATEITITEKKPLSSLVPGTKIRIDPQAHGNTKHLGTEIIDGATFHCTDNGVSLILFKDKSFHTAPPKDLQIGTKIRYQGVEATYYGVSGSSTNISCFLMTEEQQKTCKFTHSTIYPGDVAKDVIIPPGVYTHRFLLFMDTPVEVMEEPKKVEPLPPLRKFRIDSLPAGTKVRYVSSFTGNAAEGIYYGENNSTASVVMMNLTEADACKMAKSHSNDLVDADGMKLNIPEDKPYCLVLFHDTEVEVLAEAPTPEKQMEVVPPFIWRSFQDIPQGTKVLVKMSEDNVICCEQNSDGTKTVEATVILSNILCDHNNDGYTMLAFSSKEVAPTYACRPRDSASCNSLQGKNKEVLDAFVQDNPDCRIYLRKTKECGGSIKEMKRITDFAPGTTVRIFPSNGKKALPVYEGIYHCFDVSALILFKPDQNLNGIYSLEIPDSYYKQYNIPKEFKRFDWVGAETQALEISPSMMPNKSNDAIEPDVSWQAFKDIPQGSKVQVALTDFKSKDFTKDPRTTKQSTTATLIINNYTDSTGGNWSLLGWEVGHEAFSWIIDPQNSLTLTSEKKYIKGADRVAWNAYLQAHPNCRIAWVQNVISGGGVIIVPPVSLPAPAVEEKAEAPGMPETKVVEVKKERTFLPAREIAIGSKVAIAYSLNTLGEKFVSFVCTTNMDEKITQVAQPALVLCNPTTGIRKDSVLLAWKREEAPEGTWLLCGGRGSATEGIVKSAGSESLPFSKDDEYHVCWVKKETVLELLETPSIAKKEETQLPTVVANISTPAQPQEEEKNTYLPLKDIAIGSKVIVGMDKYGSLQFDPREPNVIETIEAMVVLHRSGGLSLLAFSKDKSPPLSWDLEKPYLLTTEERQQLAALNKAGEFRFWWVAKNSKAQIHAPFNSIEDALLEERKELLMKETPKYQPLSEIVAGSTVMVGLDKNGKYPDEPLDIATQTCTAQVLGASSARGKILLFWEKDKAPLNAWQMDCTWMFSVEELNNLPFPADKTKYSCWWHNPTQKVQLITAKESKPTEAAAAPIAEEVKSPPPKFKGQPLLANQIKSGSTILVAYDEKGLITGGFPDNWTGKTLEAEFISTDYSDPQIRWKNTPGIPFGWNEKEGHQGWYVSKSQGMLLIAAPASILEAPKTEPVIAPSSPLRAVENLDIGTKVLVQLDDDYNITSWQPIDERTKIQGIIAHRQKNTVLILCPKETAPTTFWIVEDNNRLSAEEKQLIINQFGTSEHIRGYWIFGDGFHVALDPMATQDTKVEASILQSDPPYVQKDEQGISLPKESKAFKAMKKTASPKKPLTLADAKVGDEVKLPLSTCGCCFNLYPPNNWEDTKDVKVGKIIAINGSGYTIGWKTDEMVSSSRLSTGPEGFESYIFQKICKSPFSMVMVKRAKPKANDNAFPFLLACIGAAGIAASMSSETSPANKRNQQLNTKENS